MTLDRQTVAPAAGCGHPCAKATIMRPLITGSVQGRPETAASAPS
jgi:hypothetical protein